MRLIEGLLVILYFTHRNKGEDVILLKFPFNNTEEMSSYAEEERPWCPPSNDILPCTCDGPPRFLLFQCDRITDIRSVIRATASVSFFANFGKFSLTNSRITAIESNILNYVSFEYIFLRKNTISKISKEFFDSSRDTLIRIEIIHNDVEKFPFKELSSFPKLQFINLKYNSIKSLPDDAFGCVYNEKIKRIDLSFNKINHIGSNSFKYLNGLEEIDLRYNKLTVINNLAFSAIRENLHLYLNLANNKIMFISEGAFQNQVFKCLNLTDNNLTGLSEKVFTGLLKRMADTRTGTIALADNRFRCTCQRVGWLLRLPHPQRLALLDMTCSDLQDKPLMDLTLADVGCT